MKQESLYDPKCRDLAEHFLGENPPYGEDDLRSLSLDIQVAVEDWFKENDWRKAGEK